MILINQESLKKFTGLNSETAFQCNDFGMSNSTHPNVIAFIDTEKFIDEVNQNQNITVVMCTHVLAEMLKNKVIVKCDDPRYYYYTYLNKLVEINYKKTISKISPTAIIHPRAYICEYNVVIGDNTYIGPNATVLADVQIGNNCYIKSGAVIGSEGFELKRTSKGIINVLHDGKVLIGNDVKIGANCAIHKGFSFRNTIIADDVKIDDLVYIAHAVHIGKGCFLIGNSMISGSTTLKENIWVGPGVTVSNGLTIEDNAYLTIGSVVTKNVAVGEKVSGNFAISHEKFIENLKKIK
ncbi:MAG: UDP-3-O-(3-hydroxymyristoyl)glucosamine N-acyltransferase [Bacteroidetes bacterium]|nr:UDP-3-O-(3-hydroxymyristoyl)glucosamine N-acyltransferase [Bacteroidota bacterium]